MKASTRENRKTVYLLDPERAVFKAVTIDAADPQQWIANLIGCEAADCLAFDKSHVLYFDDQGLRDGVNHFTLLGGHPDPLCGRLVLVCKDPLVSSPRVSLYEAATRFQCYRSVMDPTIESSQQTDGIITGFNNSVSGFRPRIEAVTLRIE